MTDALSAAFVAIKTRVTASAEIWGIRAYFETAPAGTTYPYLIYFFAAGGEENAVRREDAKVRIGMKVVSNNYEQVSIGSSRLGELFNDRGKHDGAAEVTATGWTVQNSTREQYIFLKEFVDERPVYHMGAYYVISMGAT